MIDPSYYGGICDVVVFWERLCLHGPCSRATVVPAGVKQKYRPIVERRAIPYVYPIRVCNQARPCVFGFNLLVPSPGVFTD